MFDTTAPASRTLFSRISGSIRAVRRIVLVLLWIVCSCVIQALCLLGRRVFHFSFARAFWSVVCKILGMEVRVIGTPLCPVGNLEDRPPGQRPVIYVANHSSWLDVPTLGACLQACFVAKKDIEGWPIVGLIARLGRTIYVSRQRGATGRERDSMLHKLASGDNLILFPEGTSSDGSRVLPFLSSFFALAKAPGRSGQEQPDMVPLIQPVSIVYDCLAGLPVGRNQRSVFAWYGDMDLAPHFWHLAQWKSMRVSILLHEAIDPQDFPTRKELSSSTWQVVAEGAAALRQMKDAKPQKPPLPRLTPGGGTPSFSC